VYTTIPGRPFVFGNDCSTTLIHGGFMDATDSSQFGKGFTLLMGRNPGLSIVHISLNMLLLNWNKSSLES